MPDDRDRRPDPSPDRSADTGEQRLLSALRHVLGQEPEQVDRKGGYHGPGTRSSISPWLTLGLGYAIPALGFAMWLGTVHQQVIDLRAERASHEVRRAQLEDMRREVEVLKRRVQWLESTR